jgi:predicted Zn-dependent protease
MYLEAIEALQKGINASGGRPMLIALLGHAYAVSGRRDEAMKILGDLKHRSKREYVSSDEVALIYAALGEKDQAFTWLEKAYAEHAFVLAYLKVEPMLDSLRSDPRFADLVRRVGLPP